MKITIKELRQMIREEMENKQTIKEADTKCDICHGKKPGMKTEAPHSWEKGTSKNISFSAAKQKGRRLVAKAKKSGMIPDPNTKPKSGQVQDPNTKPKQGQVPDPAKIVAKPKKNIKQP